MDNTPNLTLPLLQPAQAQKHVTHNEALLALDALVQLSVLSDSVTLPPPEPSLGARYLIPAGALSEWEGQGQNITQWDGQSWAFFTPKIGWHCHIISAGHDLVYTSTGWRSLALQSPRLGINTTADDTNRLSLASPASLFNHAGAGHQLKLNKATTADTASLLYQKGFSGRAEMGLAGQDQFSLKVSANGSSWNTALSADGASGKINLPKGAEIAEAVTGTAVVQSETDQTAGRLALVGWMGLGRQIGLSISNLNTLAANGFYITPAASGTNAPSTHSYAVLHQQFDAANAVQIAHASHQNTLWHRRKASGTWGAWQKQLSQSDLIGEVSQSSGLATGAAFENGSTANGSFSRFADGTLICRSNALSMRANLAEGAIFKSSELSWSLPASFVGNATLAVSGPSGWASGTLANATTASLLAYSATSMAAAASYYATALGRWY